ncbi:MAG: hypothetical protein GX379_09305 [Clostridiales bacterium]|jgi:hypothetical protein|nr:hypothetical protein [Clostridiales bacterium]
MKALVYLILTQIKNKLLSIRKRPGIIILYAFVLLVIVGSVLIAIMSGGSQIDKSNVDHRILYLFLSGFGILYVYTFISSGLSTGSTYFSMADVGLLFVAPISPKKILVYGLLRTMGKTMLASIFIFYQIPNLNRLFGYGYMEIIALFLIYVVILMICQTLSIGVYIFSNGNETRKKIVRSFLYAYLGILIVSVYLIIQKEQVGILDAAKIMVDSELFSYLPVTGWAIMFFKGVIMGSFMHVLISLGLFITLGILLISLLTGHKADYYEDVLHSTEITFQRLKDYRDRRNISSTTNRKIKVKDHENGLQKGKGAIVFAYKHILEAKRSSRFVFVDSLTLFMTIGVAIAGYTMKSRFNAYIVLATVIYIQYFYTIFGRLKIELMKPYIYLIPETSFRKLVAASLSSLLKPCVDSVFIFGALALVGGVSVLQCIFMALAYCCSGAVFVGLTVVYQMVLGSQPNRILQVFLGFFIMLLVFLPAIITSVLFSTYIIPESMKFLSTLPFSIVNLISAFFMFYACRNLLDNSEFSDKM